jgi:GntR family transcriptional regulator / MocR family aminotransferase
LDETSQTTELLLAVSRAAGRPLTVQIEDQLRQAIRTGLLRAGMALPSSRDLARQLDVSRGVVVNAYRQLGAEGYLVARQGWRPRVSEAAAMTETVPASEARPQLPRFDFRPGIPDVSRFPRAAWVGSLRRTLAAMPDADLGYGDPRGVEQLRAALADYLGRVRGVSADPARVVVTNGYVQALGIICRVLVALGAKRIVVEHPMHPEQREIAVRAGLETLPVDVDSDGLQVEALARLDADAVLVTPAHQFPTGAVLSAERRAALLAWLRERDAFAIEDDYDAEYRYDGQPVGALQGLEPERIIYGGSASKTLAPALRLGWLVVPTRLLEAVAREKRMTDLSTAHIEQHAFADFLARGELDRHLRAMRTLYGKRRDALVEALSASLPEAVIEGIAAGLHAAVRLADQDDEQAILAEAGRRRIALTTTSERQTRAGRAPTLVLGYSQSPEATIRRGVRELAAAIQATRAGL